jgi:Holliday junction resolvase RusA-like endonuclease
MKRWYRIDLNPVPWAVGPIQSKRNPSGKNSAFMGKNVGLSKFQDGVRDSLSRQNPELIEGPFRMRLWFWRRIDEYETTQSRTARNHEADVTNMQKAVEDAGHKILYKNDKNNRDVRSIFVKEGLQEEGLIIMSIEPISEADLEAELLGIPDSMFIDPNQFSFEDEGDNHWPPRS